MLETPETVSSSFGTLSSNLLGHRPFLGISQQCFYQKGYPGQDFELAATNTYNNFYDILGSTPTQVWTGNGYHFIQRQFAIILDNLEKFKKFCKPSSRFLRFQEELLSGGNADHIHSNNVSFGNCYLKIIGSLNSNQVHFDEKGRITTILPEAEVRVANGRYWDGFEQSIKPLLPQYYIWLVSENAKQLDKNMESIRYYNYNMKSKKNTIGWVENLLQMPLHDFRKYIVRRILPRYLIMVRGLPRQEAFDITFSWLRDCNLLFKLDFNPTKAIDTALNNVKSYFPQGRQGLKDELPELYSLLEERGVLY